MRILVIDDEAEVGATLIAAIPTRGPTPTRPPGHFVPGVAPTSPFKGEGVYVRVPSGGTGWGMRYSAATEAA